MRKTEPWPRTFNLILLSLGLLGFLGFIHYIRPLLGALAIAVLAALLVHPVIRFFEKRFRLSRRWSVNLLVLLLLLILLGVPVLLGSALAEPLRALWGEFLIAIAGFDEWISSLLSLYDVEISISSLLENLGESIGGALPHLPRGSVQVIGGLAANFFLLVFTLAAAYVLILEASQLKAALGRLAPADNREEWRAFLDELIQIWAVFVQVQTLIFVVLTVLILAGTYLVVLLFRSGWIPFSPLLFIALVIVVITLAQQVDNLWLRPRLMGRQLKLHSGLVFVGLIGGLVVGGFWGAFLIVPLMASANLVGRSLFPRLIDRPRLEEQSPKSAGEPGVVNANQG